MTQRESNNPNDEGERKELELDSANWCQREGRREVGFNSPSGEKDSPAYRKCHERESEEKDKRRRAQLAETNRANRNQVFARASAECIVFFLKRDLKSALRSNNAAPRLLSSCGVRSRDLLHFRSRSWGAYAPNSTRTLYLEWKSQPNL